MNKLLRIFAILIFPVLEIAYVHHRINLKYFFVVANFSLFFPWRHAFILGLAFLFFLYLSQKKEPYPLSFNFPFLILNVVFFLLLLKISTHLNHYKETLGETKYWGSWSLLGVSTLLSSFFILLKPKELGRRIKSYPFEFFFGFLAGMSLFVHYWTSKSFWFYLAQPTAISVYHLLKLFGFEITLQGHMNPWFPMILEHPLFVANIAAPCSGLEGIFFFVTVYSLILMQDWIIYSLKRAVTVGVCGIIFMFILNVARITSIFVLAILLGNKGGTAEAQEVLLWSFHSHVGWIFYLVGITFFFCVVFFLERKRESAQLS